jgi:hypothetical protein
MSALVLKHRWHQWRQCLNQARTTPMSSIRYGTAVCWVMYSKIATAVLHTCGMCLRLCLCIAWCVHACYVTVHVRQEEASCERRGEWSVSPNIILHYTTLVLAHYAYSCSIREAYDNNHYLCAHLACIGTCHNRSVLPQHQLKFKCRVRYILVGVQEKARAIQRANGLLVQVLYNKYVVNLMLQYQSCIIEAYKLAVCSSSNFLYILSGWSLIDVNSSTCMYQCSCSVS